MSSVVGFSEAEASEFGRISAEIRSEFGSEASSKALASVDSKLVRPTQRPADLEPTQWSWWTASDFEHELPATTDPITVVDAHGAESSSLTWTTLVSSDRTGPRTVLHLYPTSDVLQDDAFLFQAPGHRVVSQTLFRLERLSLVVSLREYVERTLADELENPTLNWDLLRRISVLENVVEAMSSLRESGLFHGDLRPENISLGSNGASLVDFSLRVPFERLSNEQRVYLAPEARQGRPHPPSDVYSFGKIAQRLLGSALWDNRELPGTLRSDAFEWILDFCTLSGAADRPTVEHLREVLLEQDQGIARRHVKSATATAVGIASEHLFASHLVSQDQTSTAIGSATTAVARKLREFPETMLAMFEPSRVASFVERFAIDANSFVERAGPVSRGDARALAEIDYLSDPPTEIDAVWRDQIHQLHFGKGIELDHDSDMPRVWPFSGLWFRRREYVRHVQDLNEVRLDLLSRDAFIYSAGVARLMSSGSRPVTIPEVATYRRWNRLLAVSDHGRWLYPVFQFGADQQPVREIEIANAMLANDSAWEVLSWWNLPLDSLGGASLASTIHSDLGRAAFAECIRRFPH
jgi:serine/threonine protein kinase